MRSFLLGALILVLASLTACGGGGGGGSSIVPEPAAVEPEPAPVEPAPVEPASVTNIVGVITGFGSVFIGEDKVDVGSDTTVDVNGDSSTGDDSNLRVGMKVSITASDSEGELTAQSIKYDDDLRGPATNVRPATEDPSLGSFSVVQQLVVVDGNTIFDNDIGDNNADGDIDIRDLAGGSEQVVVEVSGLLISEGFLATRIERSSSVGGLIDVSDDEYEVKGFVDEVASDGSEFRINGATFLVVDSANSADGTSATVFDDGLVADSSLVGEFVEVKADQNSAGDWVAVKVEREDDFEDDNGDGQVDDDDRNGKYEIEGVVSAVDTLSEPNTVTIGSVTLEVTDATSLVGQEGNLVKIEGTFDENGVLVIGQSRSKVESYLRVQDRVTDVGASSLTTRLGVSVTPTGNSRVKDDVSDDDKGDHLTPQQFLERLQSGDYVEARAFLDASGEAIWTRIEREDEDDMDCRIQGPVQSIVGDSASDFSVVIQGVTVDVSRIISEDDFEGANGQILGRQGFFDQLSVDDVVKATSDKQGLGCELGRLTAREVEFENDDGLVGTSSSSSSSSDDDDDDDDDDDENELSGLPSEVTANTFVLNGRTISVVGSTLIDDSLVEAALGREIDSDDIAFDQLPGELTLVDLLPTDVVIEVKVTADDVAIEIEDS